MDKEKNCFPSTFSKINRELECKEFILQHNKYGYRCISWHPHYIMTEYFRTRKEAILVADEEIIRFHNGV